MRPRTIGARLTLWYASILAVALSLFCVALWIALEHSLYHAIDESLRDRVVGIRQFIEAQTDWLTLDELRQEFREHSVLGPGGDLFQVADANDDWLYRSDPLYDEHVPTYGATELSAIPLFENVTVQQVPLRFLSQTIDLGNSTYTVQVAAPLAELERGLSEFLWAALPTLPLILVIAALGGYWISRRALRPVDQITETARSISADNLTERLAVPETGDELERLSRTLNDMMGRLESSFTRISRFTADASHELRTPLALMRTTAEVALRSSSDDERVEALGTIVAELESASRLLDNLLLIARADSGQSALASLPVDLAATVREVGIQAKALARSKNLSLETTVAQDAMHVLGDREALRQLCLLLIDNAVKYTPAGGSIDLSVERQDDEAVVAVADTGIGIDEAELPHIFDRFYRVDKSRSREQGGAGLGLAIGRWIATAHGGTLTAESKVGHGSKFIVRLPRAHLVEDSKPG